MTAKLQLLQQQLPRMAGLGLVKDWRAFWGSAYWSNFVSTANLLWKQNLAMQVRQHSCVVFDLVACNRVVYSMVNSLLQRMAGMHSLQIHCMLIRKSVRRE
jgi:hypothetical protein